MVGQLLDLVWRQAKPVERVGGETHRRRDRLRTRQKACAESSVIPRDLARHIDREQAEHRYDHGEDRLRQPVGGDTANELRSHAVTDGEQEHDEEDRLDVRRYDDAQLADQDRGEKRAGNRAKTEAAELDDADPIANRERQKNREFRTALQRCDDEIHLPSPIQMTSLASFR